MMRLNINHLNKTYSNGVHAMDNINLEIGNGMFGLLGPNGAGKSTLMRTLATLQQPDSGTLTFDTIDILRHPMELRKILGYLPQEYGVYPKTSAESLLNYLAVLKGIDSKKERAIIVQHVLEMSNLYEVRKKYVHEYSGGMKQRFGIAQVLLNNPQLIIVDEPTAGLDPAERTRFLNVIRAVAIDHVVIFSTHIVEDVKDLCHEVAVMNHGQLITKLRPMNAIHDLQGKIWAVTIAPGELPELEKQFKVMSTGYDDQNKLIARIYSQSQPKVNSTTVNPTLEDAYFYFLQSDIR